jgi:hypothetical protein
MYFAFLASLDASQTVVTNMMERRRRSMTMLFSTKQVIRPSELTVWPKITISASKSPLALLVMRVTRLERPLERVLERLLERPLEGRANGKSEATAEVISASVPNALNSTKGIPESG